MTPRIQNGIEEVALAAWSEFYQVIERGLPGLADDGWRGFIWRGQRNHKWFLSSSLDRLMDKVQPRFPDFRDATVDRRAAQHHLERFKMAVRGRRGPNPPTLESEDAWWALGQHYGLATPLLDWTTSPFAAAYFATEEPAVEEPAPSTRRRGAARKPSEACFRAIYGLNRKAVELRNFEIENAEGVEIGRAPTLSFIEPLSDENPRLVAQGGLFTRAPLGVSVEQWVSAQFEEAAYPVLYRFLIPEAECNACLRALNRMNINHLSLFPDLFGASRYVNTAFTGADNLGWP